MGGGDETGAHQGGADETGAHQGGADDTGAHQGGADETGALQGGADETGAHQGGADETGALQGGAETLGRDWDLEETETQETDRAHIVSRIEIVSSLGDPRRSGASGNQDESGNSMGHGGFGVSVSNGGKLPPIKFLGNSTTSKGALWRRERQGAFWRCWVSGALAKR